MNPAAVQVQQRNCSWFCLACTHTHRAVLSPMLCVFGHSAYDRIGTVDELATVLRRALNDYNELNPAMDLVLFDDAMHHVCRISRVINNTSGHALVVGVGGSGKQSLTRLSTFISGFVIQQLCISSTYDIRDLKNDIRVGNKHGPTSRLAVDALCRLYCALKHHTSLPTALCCFLLSGCRTPLLVTRCNALGLLLQSCLLVGNLCCCLRVCTPGQP